MNRPQPDLVPRRAYESGSQAKRWLWMTTLMATVCLGSLAAFSEEYEENLEEDVEITEWEEDEAEFSSVGRAQLIPVELDEPEELDTAEDAEQLWSEPIFRRISGTQDPPFLVPLPEPQLLPVLPPVPLPPTPEPDPEPPPVTNGDRFCPECYGTSGDTAQGSVPGEYLINPDDRYGIGSQQVPFALFHIDAVEPLPQLRLRADSAWGLRTPDRAERYWAIPPVGPAQPESKVNYQTFSVYSETGGESFAAFTEIPLLSLNPDVNTNTVGIGNITVGQKFLLTNPNNRRWQIGQILRTYLPTGPASRGLGNGLTALEPGLLFRYRANELTYLHGEVKYWIPFGGDRSHAGQVVQYGTGVSRVLWQTDERAVMSTLEVIGATITDGQATLPDGTVQTANGNTFYSILPGIRMALGPSGDLGLFEVGVSSGVTFGDPGWYDSRILFDVRWSY